MHCPCDPSPLYVPAWWFATIKCSGLTTRHHYLVTCRQYMCPSCDHCCRSCCTSRSICLHPSVQFIPKQLDMVQVWRLCCPFHDLKPTILFYFSKIVLRFDLGHYPAVTPDQLGLYQRLLHDAAKSYGCNFGSVCHLMNFLLPYMTCTSKSSLHRWNWDLLTSNSVANPVSNF